MCTCHIICMLYNVIMSHIIYTVYYRFITLCMIMSLFVKNYLHIYSYTFCVVYIIYNIQHIIHVIESMYVYACVNFSLPDVGWDHSALSAWDRIGRILWSVFIESTMYNVLFKIYPDSQGLTAACGLSTRWGFSSPFPPPLPQLRRGIQSFPWISPKPAAALGKHVCGRLFLTFRVLRD